MMEARVVDFPEPVGPVTRTRPRGSLASHSAIGGSPSSSKLGMSDGIIRRASASSPLWWKALPRSLALSCQVREKSTSWCSSRMACLVRTQHAGDQVCDLGSGQRRDILERPQASVNPDPGCRATDQEQVRTVLVPEHLEPRIDSFVVVRAHSVTSVSLVRCRYERRSARPRGPGASPRMLMSLLVRRLAARCSRPCVVARRVPTPSS